MKRKLVAFAATFLAVLALVGFSGGVATPNKEPAQAWWYSYCTATNIFGGRYCVKQCYGFENYYEPNCGKVVYSNIWNA